MSRPYKQMTAKQELYTRMTARGESRADKMKLIFGVDDINTADPLLIKKYDQQMHRWKNHPAFEAVWKDEVQKILRQYSSRAIKTTARLMEDETQPWLALQAANNMLQLTKSKFIEEDKTEVHVTITGAPELGTPDGDEADG